MRDQEKVAKPPQLAQTGWCGPGIFLTTPPRPSATPPPAEEALPNGNGPIDPRWAAFHPVGQLSLKLEILSGIW
jgi:hypothetical protein